MFIFPQFLFLLSISIVISVDDEDPTDFAEDKYNEEHGNIIYSSTFFRHGDRAPMKLYPTDPHFNYHWPYGLEQLTERGRLQVFNLGKWFHKRYNSLVTTENRNQLLRMDSSNVIRTHVSAKFLLHGFFHPSEDKMPEDKAVNNEKLVNIGINHMINFEDKCKRYELELEALEQCAELEEVYSNYEETFNFIILNSGIRFDPYDRLDAITKVYFFYDTLFAEQTHDLQLPEWTNDIYPGKLEEIKTPYLKSFVYTDFMKRLRAGPLISEVVKEMESKIEGRLDTTLHFHASHELTIASILVALGLFDNKTPPYAASLIFELRKKGNEHFVTILYKTETTSAPRLLELENCKHLCTFKKFKSLVKDFILERWEWEWECKNGPSTGFLEKCLKHGSRCFN